MDKIWVEGHPNTNHRPRLHQGGGAHMDPAYSTWCKVIRWTALKEQVTKHDQPERLIIVIKAHTKTHKIQDIDNLAKGVLEGLEGVAYDNDRQVYFASLSKHPPHHDLGEGVQVSILPMYTKKNSGLTDMETQCLALLAQGHRVPRVALAEVLFNDPDAINGVTNLISRLKKRGYSIHTKRGEGYKLTDTPGNPGT